ncbi:Chitin synthase B, partial [Operophtera brumata]
NFSFTFAHSLVVPVTVNLLIVFCGMKNADPCAFHGTIPDYLFFYMPPAWICFHTWKPRCERLAATDKLFAKPWYSGVLIDQSMLFNRTKDKEVDIAVEDLKGLHESDEASIASSDHIIKDIKPSDSITR